MFTDIRKIAEHTAETFGLAFKEYNKATTVPLPFVVDLGAATNYYGFTWQVLPGQFTESSFCARMVFANAGVATGYLTGYTDASDMNGLFCAISGSTGRTKTSTLSIGSTLTGCYQGLLGSIFTSSTNLYIASQTEAFKTFPLSPGLIGAKNPFEYNGYIFFTARNATNNTPVVGWLPPIVYTGDPQYGSTEAKQRRVQYFTIENFGDNAQVGTYKGQLVVATNNGLWQIVPGQDQLVYILGEQIQNWSLSSAAKFAICLDYVMCLDSGDLYVFGDRSSIYHSTRFTSIRSNDQLIVLGSNGDEVAVTNGDGIETFRGYKSIGTMLVDAGNVVYTSDRTVRASASSVVLETTFVKLPARLAVQEIIAHPSVKEIYIVTDRGSRKLFRSLTNDRKWRAGIGGQKFKLRLVVSSGVIITPPVLYVKPRSAA